MTRLTKLALALTLVAPGLARAEHTRATYPNAFSVEMFGRGLLYGLSFDRVLSDDLAMGASFGQSPMMDAAGNDAALSATLIPFYLNVYFARDASSFFATGGATLVANSGDVKNLWTTYGDLQLTEPVVADLGLGYEYRSDNGILFRATGYGMVAKRLNPWFGLTFGYAF